VQYDNAWTGGLLNGLVFLNNGTDTPVFWDNNPANPMVEIPGWPVGQVCQAMRSFKFYLFALNVSDGAGNFINRVAWSDSADPGTMPGTWAPDITNDAGFVDLASGAGPVIDGGALRDSFIIYRANSVFAADFVGGNEVFAFRKIFASSGILNRNCWAEFDSNHVVLTDTDVVLNDGFNIRSIANQRVKKAIVEATDADNISNSFVAQNRSQNEIWVCFPNVNDTECTTAAVWDYRNDTWGIRDIPRILHAATGIISDVAPDTTWDAQNTAPQDIWDNRTEVWLTQGFSFRADGMVMAAYADTKLQLADEADDFDGLPVTASLSKEKVDFGSPEQNKLIKRVYPKLTGLDGTGVNIRIGASDTAEGNSTFTPTKLFTIGVDHHLDFTHQGRYLTFEFSSVGSAAWELTGFDVEYRLAGRF